MTLAVREQGPPDAPTVLLVHGYPDTAAVWDEVVELLSERFHTVVYDVRGSGASSSPRGSRNYRLDRLLGDMERVIETTSTNGRVHLVGHDWGSMQGWAAVTGGLAGRIASFTSISGPCLEHVGAWVRYRLRHPSPRHLRQLLGQLRRSWYMGAGLPPGVAPLAWRLGLARAWPRVLARLDGISPRPGHPAPTLLADASRGVAIYRANILRRLRSPARTTDVPVQLIVPTRDAFVSPELHADVERWVSRLRRREIDAGHWVIRSHPRQVATWVAEHVEAT